MDSSKSNKEVVLSATAVAELDEIWRWNADRYGASHANLYLRTLERAIDGLGENYDDGRLIAGRAELRYMLVRRKAKGHGHVLAYRVEADKVHLLHVFHTAQDWRSKPLEPGS